MDNNRVARELVKLANEVIGQDDDFLRSMVDEFLKIKGVDDVIFTTEGYDDYMFDVIIELKDTGKQSTSKSDPYTGYAGFVIDLRSISKDIKKVASKFKYNVGKIFVPKKKFYIGSFGEKVPFYSSNRVSFTLNK